MANLPPFYSVETFDPPVYMHDMIGGDEGDTTCRHVLFAVPIELHNNNLSFGTVPLPRWMIPGG